MASVNKSIAIIAPYFGKLPWYFMYFVNSCRFNPSIYFYIIIDDQLADQKFPKNVCLIYTSLPELKKLIEKQLKIKVAIDQAYKLCDFRPAFGIIFKTLLKRYDFWGYADIDVVFGNIRRFITNKMLKEYDVISMRHDYVLGCFSVFRNCKKINTIFKKSKDHNKVFTTAKHYCFDETNFCFTQFLEGVHYSQIDSEVESMTHLIKRLHENKHIKAYFDFHVIEGLPGKLKWSKGELIYKGKFEAVLYHLIKLKNVYNPSKKRRNVPDTFYISPGRIYTRIMR
jgi:hypothetical protein